MSRNRNGVKEYTEQRTGKANSNTSSHYKRLRNNGPAEDSISTRNDSAGGKYAKTKNRKEDIDKSHVRGGS